MVTDKEVDLMYYRVMSEIHKKFEDLTGLGCDIIQENIHTYEVDIENIKRNCRIDLEYQEERHNKLMSD